jgi:hypothetical protein
MAATVTDYETYDPNLAKSGDLRSAFRLLTRALVDLHGAQIRAKLDAIPVSAANYFSGQRCGCGRKGIRQLRGNSP